MAVATLDISADKLVDVFICPDTRVNDYWLWKSEVAAEHGIDLFFEDDELVAQAMKQQDIPCLLLKESRLLASN